jgi:hypothetical protein
MGHTDPWLAIPAGVVPALVGLHLAARPERFYGNAFVGHGWPRTLERLLGPRRARWALRVLMLVLVAWSGRLVAHGTAALLGG